MPPSTRKSAAAKTAPPAVAPEPARIPGADADVPEPDEAQAAAATVTEAAPAVETADADAATAPADPAEGDSADPAPQEQDEAAAAPLPAAAEQAAPVRAAPTYHWQSADGRPGDPCRLCVPAGPPPGAGSFGCGHGQWVRVQDAP